MIFCERFMVALISRSWRTRMIPANPGLLFVGCKVRLVKLVYDHLGVRASPDLLAVYFDQLAGIEVVFA